MFGGSVNWGLAGLLGVFGVFLLRHTACIVDR